METTGSSSYLPKVTFIEDQLLLLGLLAEYFSNSGSFCVVGAFTDGQTAMARISEKVPDLVVLDLQLPDISGLSIVQGLQARLSRPPKIVVLSSSTNPMMVKQLLRLGVQGILQKGISAREVLSACQRVMRGCLCLDLAEGDMAELSSAPLAENRPGLTSRETEILDLVARGKRSKEIAAVLGISVRTVDKHRENLMRKLGVHDVAGLVRYAAAQGLFRAGAGI